MIDDCFIELSYIEEMQTCKININAGSYLNVSFAAARLKVQQEQNIAFRAVSSWLRHT